VTVGGSGSAGALLTVAVRGAGWNMVVLSVGSSVRFVKSPCGLLVPSLSLLAFFLFRRSVCF
jgi:hypothetical protein